MNMKVRNTKEKRTSHLQTIHGASLSERMLQIGQGIKAMFRMLRILKREEASRKSKCITFVDIVDKLLNQ